MTHTDMSLKILENLESLLPELENLAMFGAARIPEKYRLFLVAIGVVNEDSLETWSTPTASWLDDTLPCKDNKELLRRTILRNYQYRAHLDIYIASVLHAIGITERWQRMEELVFGQLLPFMPRFVQLLEWQQEKNGKPIHQMTDSEWLTAEQRVTEDNKSLFSAWDDYLWGENRSPASMFPLLIDLYLPLLNIPVDINSSSIKLSDNAVSILAQLMNAAFNRDGLTIPGDLKIHVDDLIQKGLPVRVIRNKDGFINIWLVGPVSFSGNIQPIDMKYSQTQIPSGIAESVSRNTYLKSENDTKTARKDFLSRIDDEVALFTFFSIDNKNGLWPDDTSYKNPPWLKLPGKNVLKEIGKPRSLSQEVDKNLFDLCNHNLFGFLIQVLLLEALDRELGEETLLMAPPIHHRTDNIETETHIIYQPRSTSGPDRSRVRQPSYDLGLLDEIFSELARRLCIKQICYPYENELIGPWAFSIKLLRDAGIIVGHYDRWMIAPHVLDRLHGGGLMTSVIRRGRSFRERIHDELSDLWTMKEKNDQEKNVE